MVASSLSLQERAASNDDVKEALREAADRIRSVASAQRRLRLTGGQDSVDAASYFDQIVDDLRTTMPDDNVRLVTSIEPMDLPGDMALSFGVLFNELAINALRHAFDGLGNGTIAARLFKTDDSIIFQVEDDGRGIDWRNSDGAGIGSLVVDALVQSLGAEMYETDASQDDERKGTVFVIKKPLSGQQSASESAGV
jgi:two-component sensor histidine kinase